jgi:hypothetical protein
MNAFDGPYTPSDIERQDPRRRNRSLTWAWIGREIAADFDDWARP